MRMTVLKQLAQVLLAQPDGIAFQPDLDRAGIAAVDDEFAHPASPSIICLIRSIERFRSASISASGRGGSNT